MLYSFRQEMVRRFVQKVVEVKLVQQRQREMRERVEVSRMEVERARKEFQEAKDAVGRVFSE